MGQSLGFTSTPIAGVVVIDSALHSDERGHFARLWCVREFAENGIAFIPLQANIGYSRRRGTLRGVHYQAPPALEAKLVRCTRGVLFDIVVDMRANSSTYLRWYGIELAGGDGRTLFIPEGCAHGYQTLQDDTEIYYMASQFFTPGAARGVRFDDPAVGIRWPLPPSIISEQDLNWELINTRRQ